MSSSSMYQALSKDTHGAADSLRVMIQQEMQTYRRVHYFQTPSSAHPPSQVHEEDRTKIADWCYSIVDHCQFSRETVAFAMELVDRYMSSNSPLVEHILCSRKLYQLAAMASLYIGIKLNERVAFSSENFEAMSRGVYTVEEIETMEMEILRGVGWRVNGPTALQMANNILSIALPQTDVDEKTWGFILEEVRFQSEHAVRDYYFTTQRMSTVAIACIFNALEQVSQDARLEILNALLFILQEFEFDSATTLFEARSRLSMLLSSNEAEQKEVCMIEANETLRTRTVSLSDSDSDMKIATIPVNISPRAVSVSR